MSLNTSKEDLVNEDDTCPLHRVSPAHSSHVDKAKSRWITVEPIIILAFVGIGSFSTIRSEYLQKRIAKDEFNYTFPSDSNHSCGISNTSDPEYVIQQQIQHETANWSLYLGVCSTLPLIFSSIVVGKWSDIKGRKLALLVPILGMLVQSTVYLIVIYLHLSMYLLYIAEVVYGLTGGSALIVSISLAYIADVTTIEQRTFRVVVVETSLIFSIGVAQLAIGYLIAAKGFDPPFYLLISCQLVAVLYICLPKLLYESIELEKDGESFFSQMSKLFHGIFDLFANNEDNRRWRLLLINAIFVPIIVVIYGYTATLPLYVIGHPFCWSSVLVGIYNIIALSIFSFSNVVGTLLLGLCMSDIWILQIGLASSVASMTLLGLAEDTLVVFMSAVIGCIRALPLAIARSMASKSVSASEQGVTFSVLASLDALGAFVGPLVLQLLYSSTVLHGNPGTPFFVAAALGVLAEILALILHCGFLTCKSGKIRGT